MRPQFFGLRVTLLIVILVNFVFAFLFVVSPETLGAVYGIIIVDAMHRFLAMVIGALLGVFALGALLAFLLPKKYGTIIVMLLLMHFSLFLIDVVNLSRGDMALRALVPEMLYFLVISAALVRFTPGRLREEAPGMEGEKKVQ